MSLLELQQGVYYDAEAPHALLGSSLLWFVYYFLCICGRDCITTLAVEVDVYWSSVERLLKPKVSNYRNVR